MFIDFSGTGGLLSIGLAILLIVLFKTVLKRQSQAMSKFDQSLKNQEMVLKRFDNVIKELRQANRSLNELAAVEWTDEGSTAHAAHPHAHTHQQGSAEQDSFCPVHDHEPEYTAEDSESSSTANEYKLYVGNIDYAVTEPELAAHFAEYGQVEGANIPVNRYNGRARGFGFVTFSSRAEAEKAMILNGTTFKGRQIQVNFAKERESGS
jgi:hypothetical protein